MVLAVVGAAAWAASPAGGVLAVGAGGSLRCMAQWVCCWQWRSRASVIVGGSSWMQSGEDRRRDPSVMPNADALRCGTARRGAVRVASAGRWLRSGRERLRLGRA